MIAKNRHLFVIDSLESLNKSWDTSIKLAFVLSKQGAEVFCTLLSGLALSSHPLKASAHCQKMSFKDSPASAELSGFENIGFESFQFVHMRKEPPYDLAYVEALWILSAGTTSTKILNNPSALLKINEKLVIADFKEYSKPLLVSSDPSTLAKFAIEECGGDIVAKPLNLFGGRGVVRLHNAKTLLEDLTKETAGGTATRLVQKFEPKVALGEVRAFAVCGEAIGWCLKTPSSGEFLANTRAGSTLKDYKPTDRELKMVTDVSKKLMARGVYVSGFDIIDGFLSEINITCPAMLNPERDSLAGFDRFAELINKL